ncbi:hypothetical protein OG401_14380 [Kitasatospora purpeofusca]|uniref:hypothetical protein n=1 Tax=Kitasatospora purpeofusca TaxID=67352 RepID=UPI002254FB36|nr:hypothetical protein [Kitasatospora purpeofusca]MCX4685486.1 hypothetical protein [Kitasatospora purpeofusca]
MSDRPPDLDHQLAELYRQAGFQVEDEARGDRIRLRALLDEAAYGPFNPNAPGLVIFNDATAEVERDGRLLQFRGLDPDQKRSA